VRNRIHIGSLDRRIKLQSPVEEKDSLGQPIITWKDRGEVWARIDFDSSNEALNGRDEVAVEKLKVVIRYIPGLSSNWSAVYGGNQYKIIGAPEEVGRGHWHRFAIERMEAS